MTWQSRKIFQKALENNLITEEDKNYLLKLIEDEAEQQARDQQEYDRIQADEAQQNIADKSQGIDQIRQKEQGITPADIDALDYDPHQKLWNKGYFTGKKTI